MEVHHPVLSIYDKPLEWLNKLLQRDSSYRDIKDLLEIDANGKATFSGTKELDYPSNFSANLGDVETVKSFPLPFDLVEKFGAMQKNCLMGVFTACERAWITIDNELFMWNYEDGEDLAYYDGIPDTIVCVGLASASPGILPERVRYLLCIATPSEIFLLGMIYSDTPSDASDSGETTNYVLQVIPDPLFQLPTDNYNVSCIEGTSDGRIFLGTREGYLLEMTYGPIPNWCDESTQFSPGRTGPCSLINHSASTLSMLLPSVLTSRFRNGDSICQIAVDFDRHLLYTRTEDSYLTVYSYSEKSLGSSFSRLASLSSSDLSGTASSVVRSVDRVQFKNLITITPLSSGLCYLMAITKTGIRLYFGENLRLLHIRLPPASLCDTVGLGEVKLAVETRGTVVLISAVPPRGATHSLNRLPSLDNSIFKGRSGQFADSSLLTSAENPSNNEVSLLGDSSSIPPHIICTISPDPYPWTPNLTEVFSASWCVGGAWALVLLPQKDSILGADLSSDLGSSGSGKNICDSLPSANSKPISRGQPPVVLTQHLDPPYRRLLLISAQGLVHLRIASPLTKLREFLNREISSSFVSGPTSLLSCHLDHTNLLQNVDSGFLSQFLHQFSPDEAICAAVAIAASAGQTYLNSNNDFRFVIEQTIFYFAAEASQYWTPAIVRPRPTLSAGSADQKLSGRSTQSEDKSITSGLFLFSGLYVFFARVARTFWKSPLFRDATDVIAKCDSKTKSSYGRSGLRSIFHNFVQVLATVSPMGKDSHKACSNQVIISRLDTCEITWLIQQLTYLQQFIQKQLTLRGGWFRASSTGQQMDPLGVRSSASSGSEHLELVLLQRLVEDVDNLLSVILEILGFWKLFSEHVVHKIMSRLSPEHRNLAINMPFEVYASSLLDIPFGSATPGSSMFTSSIISHSPMTPDPSGKTSSTMPSSASSTTTLGAELIGALISALIEYYLVEIGDGDYEGRACVDTITSKLQSTCPTLFANEDAMCAKASECLIQAAVIRSNLISTLEESNLSTNTPSDEYISSELAQLDLLVSEALNLYIEAGPSINLDNAIQRLEASWAWRGAVRLCLAVARSRDPSDVAVDCLKQGRRPSSDPLIKSGQKLSSYRLKTRRVYAESELSATEGRYDCYHRLIVCMDRLLEMAQLNPSSTDVFQLELSNDDLLNQTQMSKTIGLNESKMVSNHPVLKSSNLVNVDSSPYSIRLTLQSILQDVIKTDDILAHFEVFGWLLSHGFTDTAVSLGSPHLEAYLRSRLRQTPDDPNLRCLLWRQLERRGARLEAAQVLEHLAVTPCRQLNLEDRLDFAARAIVAVKALPAAQQDLDYLHDLEARLEIAQLQQQLYLELCQCASQLRQNKLGSPPRSRGLPFTSASDIEEALSQLSHGPLLSLSEMFTDYADRYGLHESKLHLLWTSGSQDAALIKAVWRDMLRRILTTSNSGAHSPIRGSPYVKKYPSRGSGQTNQQLIDLALVDCLARLGNRFLNELTSTPTLSSIFFPLPEIVSILEYYAIQQDLPCTWVPNILRDARLTCIASITEAYDELLHSKDSIWRRADVRERLFTAMLTVIDDFLNQTSVQLSVRHRMLQTDRLLDQITAILVDLNSETTGFSGDKESKEKLIGRLRRTHDQLQRFYR